MEKIFGELARDWRRAEHAVAEHLPHHHPASAAQAAAPATIKPTQEAHMSLSTDLHAVATRLENLGEEAVTGLEAVIANPETARVFGVLHQLTGVNLNPGIIAPFAAGLEGLLQLVAPAQAPAQPQVGPVPAGPQVAGQA